MDPANALFAAPRRLSPAAAAALGLALGFYPRALPAALPLAAALCLAGLAAALRGLARLGAEGGRPASGPRAWAALCLACAIGLTAGAGLARDDSARSLFAASTHFAGPAAGEGAAGRSGPRAATAAAAAPPAARALRLAAVEGELSTDSCPVKNGFRSYPVAVSRIALSGAAAEGELSFGRGPPGEIRVLAREGPALDAGARLRAAGRAGAGVLFAARRDLAALGGGGPAARARGAARRAIRSALARAGGRAGGLLEALLLGSREGLEAETAEAFKAAGCSHVLALSGQHLSVLALLVASLLKPLCGPARARLGAALGAAAFTWLAGAGPSLLRAAIMAWIGALALRLDRPQSWLDLLALCFLIALPLDPPSARSLGFLLSYLAVWGLAVLAPRFEFLLSPLLPPALCAAAAASLGAQAATSPLLAFAFGSLQFAGILASMASAPLVAALMWWGMAAGALCALVPPLARLAAPLSGLLADLLVGVMRVAASVPPLSLPSAASRLAASAAVVLAAGLVYAHPWLAWKRSLRRGARSRGPAASCMLGPCRAPASPPTTTRPPPSSSSSRPRASPCPSASGRTSS